MCFVSCRTKNEVAYTFTYMGQKVDITTALYMCFMLDADMEFETKATELADEAKTKYESYKELKYEDKDWVKDDIDDGTNHSCHHTDFGKSLCGDEWVHTHNDQYEYASQNINTCIIYSIWKGYVTCSEHTKKGRGADIKYNGKNNCKYHQQSETVTDNFFSMIIVFLSHRDGCKWSTAGACQHGKCIDQH